MKDFETIKHFCEENNKISSKVVDDYLIYYAAERNNLEFQAENPWRFSFSVIKGNPAENFYIMEDVFSEEEFLLYSPGITVTLKAQPVILWFNMIAFNGSCWQSYGPIGAYRSFEPDDIFFFATELRPDIENEEELLENLDNNPLPYMMLLCGANYPLIANKKDQMLHIILFNSSNHLVLLWASHPCFLR